MFKAPHCGAALDLSLMLGDFHAHRWNVEDLPPLVARTGHCRQRRLALRTDRHIVVLHMLGLRHGLQGLARMTSLGAHLLAAGRTQAARLRFLETVTGGRFATIAAVLGQLVFQDLHPPFQGAHYLSQFGNDGNDGVFALAV